ncbi:hypothetical protein [Subtercola sp. YIM 133946]|uniref:hypothetical protein n=1 Tax=Subtercola sp. YIM 133946 TaxID=3118909 RepID=UPI002F93DA24
MLVLLIIATFGIVIGLIVTLATSLVSGGGLLGPCLLIIGGVALIAWLMVNALEWERTQRR